MSFEANSDVPPRSLAEQRRMSVLPQFSTIVSATARVSRRPVLHPLSDREGCALLAGGVLEHADGRARRRAHRAEHAFVALLKERAGGRAGESGSKGLRITSPRSPS